MRVEDVPPTEDRRRRVPLNRQEETYEALADLVELATRALDGCDAAGISLVYDGGVTTAVASHAAARAVDDAQYRSGDGPCLTAIRVQRPTLVDDFTGDQRWPVVSNEAAAAGICSALSLPLRDGATSLGALNLYSRVPHGFNPETASTAGSLARHAGLALAYLQRYHDERAERDRARAMAETLQRQLLPTVSSLPRLAVAARYLPSAAGTSVGGDWYDVFALPDGSVGVAVGDVMGHGLEAAAAMGQLRSVLRSYAFEGSSPAVVLERMDRLVQGFDMAQLATAIYGQLVLDEGGGRLKLSNAGHLAPLVRRADGTVVAANAGHSTLIGCPTDEAAPRREGVVAIENGATMFLFTDGLVEGRGRDLDVGLRRLTDAIRALPACGSVEPWCDTLLAAMRAAESDDDVALVALRVLPPA